MSGFWKKLFPVLSVSLGVLFSASAACADDWGGTLPDGFVLPEQFIWLGDSLTDQGNDPFTGSFSPHADTWPRWLLKHMRNHGNQGDPERQGGLNFAFEGATIRGDEVFFAREAFKNPNLDKDAAIFLWLGANDLLHLLYQIRRFPIGAPAIIDHGTATAVDDYANLLSYLMGQGFHFFVVSNMPDISRVPAVKAAGALAEEIAQLLTQTYNNRLEAMLNTQYKDVNIATLDINGMFNDLLDHPQEYGFKFKDGFACLPGTAADNCLERYKGALDDYIFADELHPTGKVQRIIGDYAYSVLLAPVEVGTLPMMEVASEHMASNAFMNALDSLSDTHTGEVHYLISAGYYSYDAPTAKDLKDNQSAQYRARVSMMVDQTLSQSAHFGLFSQLSFGHGDLFGQFSYRMSDYLVGMYYRWLMRRLTLTWSAGLGVTNFPYLGRHFSLGPLVQRIEEGSTFGYHGFTQLRLDLPLIHRRQYEVSAFSSIDGHLAFVRPYAESGGRPTTMHFDRQKQQYILGTVGLRWLSHYHWHDRDLLPGISVSWTHNFATNPPVTRASLVTFPHWFWLPAFGYERDQFLLSASVSTQWSRSLMVRVDLNQYLKKSLIDPSGVNVNLIYKF